jgi:GxxExxY protein
MSIDDPLTGAIIACCYKVHGEIGPGFSEKIYHRSLLVALDEAGLEHETEKQYPVFFHNKKVGSLIVDLEVSSKVIVEVKAVTGKMPVLFHHQVISYLKVSGKKVGLLVNFGNDSCQVKRFMN